jgi:hypothetical protein
VFFLYRSPYLAWQMLKHSEVSNAKLSQRYLAFNEKLGEGKAEALNAGRCGERFPTTV